MLPESILPLPALRELTKLQRPADIRRQLERDGIVVFGDGDSIFTTTSAMDLAARVKLGLEKPSKQEFM